MSDLISYGVAIVGCGTVGGATAARLIQDREMIAQRTGIDIEVRYIVDVAFDNARALGLDESLFQQDLAVALEDEKVDTIVELVGGTTIAREFTERSLRTGKHVVTANKALLAEHGTALWSLAREQERCIAFEASCAGGIPIIRALCDGLLANRIDALYGIVNGTCNSILTDMIQHGLSYEDALRDAQESGLAEADPTLDVSGYDSAHKLAIMAPLAFGQQVDLSAIPVEGIDRLQLLDVSYGAELGYIVKLLAVAQTLEGGISLRVRPCFIGTDHPLAWVSGPFNAVSVYGHAVGHTMYYGRGAGGAPTSSAVISDIISLALGVFPAQFKTLRVWPDLLPTGTQHNLDEIRSRYYIRCTVADVPGVFASISSILSEHGISIMSVLQKEPPEEDKHASSLPVVITTHEALEGDVRKAISQIDRLNTVLRDSVCISILDEHTESIRPGLHDAKVNLEWLATQSPEPPTW